MLVDHLLSVTIFAFLEPLVVKFLIHNLVFYRCPKKLHFV